MRLFMLDAVPMSASLVPLLAVEVVQQIEFGRCEAGMMTIDAEPNTEVWLWVGPTTFSGPVNEYDDGLHRDGAPQELIPGALLYFRQ